jgi:hypothetical protein
MNAILNDMPKLNAGIKALESLLSPPDLKILRRHEPFTEELAKKLIYHTMGLALALFRNHPDVKTIPTGPEVRDTFLFRLAIASTELGLRKIETGAAGKVASDKLRNDFVDVVFATYATFFDGLLSNDKGAQETFVTTDYLLREVFVRPSPDIN